MNEEVLDFINRMSKTYNSISAVHMGTMVLRRVQDEYTTAPTSGTPPSVTMFGVPIVLHKGAYVGPFSTQLWPANLWVAVDTDGKAIMTGVV